MENCTMVDEHKALLTDLKLTIFGNGSKENALITRVIKLENVYHKINTQLTILTIFTGILLVVQIPELLRLFGVLI